MFTGIIEKTGRIVSLQNQANNVEIMVESDISSALKIDQSVSHNGVCLTVTQVEGNTHTLTAVQETLQKTNLGLLSPGHIVNLERCMPANGRFDGHFVQGHVDQTGICTDLADEGGSWRFTFTYDTSTGNFTVEKGSITVNGVSLTVVDSVPGQFSVAIIPYTYEHTNFNTLHKGSVVNLEFDILGKYIKKIMDTYLQTRPM
jgi:riboflavin synthase